MTIEELKQDLEAKGWKVEIVTPQPDRRFRRMSHRDIRADDHGIVATRGGTEIIVRGRDLPDAALRLMQRLGGMSRAA